MALQGPIPVDFGTVFPHGVYAAGEFEPVRDLDRSQGGQLRRSSFSKTWAAALAKAGLASDVHVHDLRHTGKTFAAETGASLAELVNRMGHSSTRAAQVYLHAREERGQQIAATLDKMARRDSAAPGSAAAISNSLGQGLDAQPTTREPIGPRWCAEA